MLERHSHYIVNTVCGHSLNQMQTNLTCNCGVCRTNARDVSKSLQSLRLLNHWSWKHTHRQKFCFYGCGWYQMKLLYAIWPVVCASDSKSLVPAWENLIACPESQKPL